MTKQQMVTRFQKVYFVQKFAPNFFCAKPVLLPVDFLWPYTAESKDQSTFSNSNIFSSVGGTEAQMEASQE